MFDGWKKIKRRTLQRAFHNKDATDDGTYPQHKARFLALEVDLRAAQVCAREWGAALAAAHSKGAALGRCLQRITDNASEESVGAPGGTGAFTTDFANLMDKFDEYVVWLRY